MPFPTPVTPGVPTGSAVARPKMGRSVLVLVVTALVLAGATAVLGQDAGLVALGLATAALFAAAVLGLRAQLVAVSAEPAPVPARVPAERPAADATVEQLTQLRDSYVSAVNQALDEGDTARARELADAYSDDALRLITG